MSTSKSLLRNHEKEKKNYSITDAPCKSSTGTLTPLILTTFGAMGHECRKYHKTLAEKISRKNDEKYEEAMRYNSVKLSFLVLKSTLMRSQGSKTIKKNIETGDDFGVYLHEMRVYVDLIGGKGEGVQGLT